ncbi:hypothetical protein BLOT_010188 [Blomia tropicalis]|nr:hypothetical protein BLOT_010188 [Blomia tropicalis]
MVEQKNLMTTVNFPSFGLEKPKDMSMMKIDGKLHVARFVQYGTECTSICLHQNGGSIVLLCCRQFVGFTIMFLEELETNWLNRTNIES